MTELPLHISNHTQLNTEGEPVGRKYTMTIVVDGIPFHSASFFGDDETVLGKADRVRAMIRDAEIVINR